MAEYQPPGGLRDKIADAIPYELISTPAVGIGDARRQKLADVMLAALFDACEVREQPHMVLFGGTRTRRRLILAYPLPDLPEPPAPEGLADLIRSRIGNPPPVPPAGEEPTDG